MSAFSELLLYYRMKYGLSQRAAGRGSNMDKSFVSRLESEQRQPSRNTVIALGESIGLTEEETDRLLMAAEFMPLNAGSMLSEPKLAHLDDLLSTAKSGVREEIRQGIDNLLEIANRHGESSEEITVY